MTDTTHQESAKPGIFKRAVRALSTADEDIEAAQLREQAESVGAQPVSSCHAREQVTVRGTVRSMTLRPRSGAPSLEVELYDGSASVTLIWLGRREIAGITPGRRLRATGCLSVADGSRIIFNPRYELVVGG